MVHSYRRDARSAELSLLSSCQKQQGVHIEEPKLRSRSTSTEIAEVGRSTRNHKKSPKMGSATRAQVRSAVLGF